MTRPAGGKVILVRVLSAAEVDQWRTAGESVWETAGGEIDGSVIERMVALR